MMNELVDMNELVVRSRNLLWAESNRDLTRSLQNNFNQLEYYVLNFNIAMWENPDQTFMWQMLRNFLWIRSNDGYVYQKICNNGGTTNEKLSSIVCETIDLLKLLLGQDLDGLIKLYMSDSFDIYFDCVFKNELLEQSRHEIELIHSIIA